MNKKKLDSLSCSQESEDSGSGLKARWIKEDLCPALIVQLCFTNFKTPLLDVSGQMKSTNMPAKSIENNSETKNSKKVISEKSDQVKYLTLTYLRQVFPVSLFPLLEGVKVSKTSQGELFSLKLSESLEIKDQTVDTSSLCGSSDLIQSLNKRIRRLTPIECERLQGFPDNWTEGVSDTQRYKMTGNAVSVPVIEAIGRKILSLDFND